MGEKKKKRTVIKKIVNEKFAYYTRTTLYKNIKKDLLDQLERNGTVGRHFNDLVDDYMVMWVTKCLLNDDIKERGVLLKYDNGGGQKGSKKNDSVNQQISINKQMLALLLQLGIETSKSIEDEDDDL